MALMIGNLIFTDSFQFMNKRLSKLANYLSKDGSFGSPRVPSVNCCQFMYLVISHLGLRAGCGI